MPEFFLQALRGAAGLLRGCRERPSRWTSNLVETETVEREPKSAKLRVLWGEPPSEDHAP